MNKNGIVGLVAISNHNYGSQLQAYAMHQILKNLDIDNEIILYKQSVLKQIKRLLNKSFVSKKIKECVRNILCKIKYPYIAKGLSARDVAFEEFKSKYCSYSQFISKRSELERYIKRYKAIVLGSDQVWHPTNLEMDYFTLNFVPEYIPKIAYAPSFGVNMIPQKQLKRTREYLTRINEISVRELSGADIVKELIGRDVPTVCDPTALLQQHDWDDIRGKKKYTSEKYIFCYFLGSNQKHREFANFVKRITGYQIVVLQHLDELIKADIGFGDVVPYDVGPQDFISLVAEAEIVITDSFHGTMFSIYYHKNFWALPRFNSGDKHSTNYRVVSILKRLGLDDRLCMDLTMSEQRLNEDIDWASVEVKLNEFRGESLSYLNENIDKYGLRIRSTKKMVLAEELEDSCTGCTACYNACPQKCISMEESQEGFKYPYIDMDKCNQCGLCRSICPIMNKGESFRGQAYSVRNMDKAIRMSSSSGGFFYSLAEWIINHNGIVVGAKLDENMKVRHVLVERIHDIKHLQASKYVQSELGNVFSQIKEKLNQGRYVLFCGTPCQAVGLKRYLRHDYEKLLISDIVCYGVPSPGLFEKYVEHLEKKHDSRIKEFYFRDKTYGYASPNVKAIFCNGDMEEMTSDVKSYTKTFFSGLSTRRSCFDCKFKGEKRETDFTLGDLWNVKEITNDMDDDTGVTLVFAHTLKAMDVLMKLNNIELVEVPYEKAVDLAGPMLKNSTHSNTNRIPFFADIKVKAYMDCVNQYCPDSVMNKLANIFKPMLKRSGILKLGILKFIKERKIIFEKSKYSENSKNE